MSKVNKSGMVNMKLLIAACKQNGMEQLDPNVCTELYADILKEDGEMVGFADECSGREAVFFDKSSVTVGYCTMRTSDRRDLAFTLHEEGMVELAHALLDY